MQPAHTGNASQSRRTLKRWGPLAGIGAAAAIGVGALTLSGGGDDDTATTQPAVDSVVATPSDSAAPVVTGSADTSTPVGDDGSGGDGGGDISYPLSFSQAQELGIDADIDWGERCDTTTGRLAVPDYFAPECVAPWPDDADNGGSTDTGVTGDSITIVYYEGQEGDPIISYVTDAIAVADTNEQQFEMMANIIDYYETYFETYGRSINLVTYEGTGDATNVEAARADAIRIVEEYQPFVVFGGPALNSAFADELAASEVMCIGCTPGQPPEWYVERDPYVWGLDGSARQKQTHVVEFIGKQLAGQPAIHAGDQFTTTERTFGLVYLQSSAASDELAQSLAEQLEQVGAPLAEIIPYELNPATIQQSAIQVITKLKAAGVTTVIFSGDPVAPRDFTREATAQEYFPEWLVAASTLVDTTAFARTYDQEQWQHAFGVTSLAARVNPTEIGYYAIYEWFTGTPPPAPDTIGVVQPNPALFFAILQEAGPNLTHETWRDAAFASAGTIPAVSQPFLTYGDKGYWPDIDYQGVDDTTLIWWDPSATGLDEIRKDGTGMWQYVDGGARHLPGEWPTEDRLFNADGAVTLYDTPPPGEAPLDYPSPAS
jgi:hypothetical protein